MELIKDYDFIIDYHPEKANIIVDALSRKSSATLTHIRTAYVPLLVDLKTLWITLECDFHRFLVANFVLLPILIDQNGINK